MVEEISTDLAKFSKETIVTALIFFFGILMFLAGYYLGEHVEYIKIKDNYKAYCKDFGAFGNPLIVPNNLNVSFGGYNNIQNKGDR